MKNPIRLLMFVAGYIATAHLVLSGIAFIVCLLGVPIGNAKLLDWFVVMFSSLAAAYMFFLGYETLR